MSKQYDRTQLGSLYSKYESSLHAFIRKQVGNEEDARDILQDVMLQLVNTVEIAQTPIEHVSGWLYRTARNFIINHGKKKHEYAMPSRTNEQGDLLKDFTEILFGGDKQNPEMNYLRKLVWEELDRALSELPAEQREAFSLTELDGLPVKEVAATLGVSVNTLLSRKHYAVLHLRKRLSSLYREILEA